MNELIKQLAEQAENYAAEQNDKFGVSYKKTYNQKFAQLIVKETCGLIEQAEDDAYHCFEPSERSTEYIEWLLQWRTRFEKHFGIE